MVVDQIIALSFAMSGRRVGPSSVFMKLRGGSSDEIGVPGALPIHQYEKDDNSLTDEDIIRAHEDSLRLYEAMSQCEDGYIAHKLHSAMEILSDSIRLYGPEQLFSSYNGGKDAVVIMHILRAVVAKYSADNGKIYRPQFIYFAIDDEFPEVLQHIDETTHACALHLTKYECNIKVGLQEHVEKMKADGLVTPAFALGTRKADPNCGNQEAFSPSSSWMPAFMRVNPILDWEYGHVWHFLRTFKLPYCELYDQGYTSLGKKGDTRPNPALKRKNLLTAITGKTSYWPAYMLSDWTLERAGRGLPVESAVEQGEACNAELGNDKASSTGERSGMSGKEGDAKMSAGLLIIGDEILSGFTQEVNLVPTTKALSSIGVPLRKVAVVSDDISDIVEEVLRLTQRYDFLITSGGVGPTHDDVTMKAIARALGDRDIVENPEMLGHLQRITGKKPEEMEEGVRALAQLPEGSELLFPPPEAEEEEKVEGGGQSDRDGGQNGKKEPWPVLKVESIFVLPGIPQYFAEKIETIAKHFIHTTQVNELQYGKSIVLGEEERTILSTLNRLVEEHPLVKIGSYPYVDDPKVKTIITVQADESKASEVDACVEALCMQLPSDAVLRVEA